MISGRSIVEGNDIKEMKPLIRYMRTGEVIKAVCTLDNGRLPILTLHSNKFIMLILEAKRYAYVSTSSSIYYELNKFIKENNSKTNVYMEIVMDTMTRRVEVIKLSNGEDDWFPEVREYINKGYFKTTKYMMIGDV